MSVLTDKDISDIMSGRAVGVFAKVDDDAMNAKEYTEKDIRNTYNAGYACGMEQGEEIGRESAIDRVLEIIDTAHFDLDDSAWERDVYMRVSEYRKWMKKAVLALKE